MANGDTLIRSDGAVGMLSDGSEAMFDTPTACVHCCDCVTVTFPSTAVGLFSGLGLCVRDPAFFATFINNGDCTGSGLDCGGSTDPGSLAILKAYVNAIIAYISSTPFTLAWDAGNQWYFKTWSAPSGAAYNAWICPTTPECTTPWIDTIYVKAIPNVFTSGGCKYINFTVTLTTDAMSFNWLGQTVPPSSCYPVRTQTPLTGLTAIGTNTIKADALSGANVEAACAICSTDCTASVSPGADGGAGSAYINGGKLLLALAA